MALIITQCSINCTDISVLQDVGYAVNSSVVKPSPVKVSNTESNPPGTVGSTNIAGTPC